MMAILLALSLAITLGLSFEVCRLRKISGKNREITREQIEAQLTREDVRQQLAKNPLEWEVCVGGIGVFAPNVDLNDSVETRYYIARGRLYIEANYLDDRLYGEPLHNSDDLDELKAKAEAHRLDLACRMLGVTE